MKEETNNRAESISPTDLARKVLAEIWNISGENSEICLYTFIELFIFKYLSDLKILTKKHSFYHLFNLYNDQNEKEVLEYYSSTIRPYIKELFPQGADGTTIINGSIFISEKENKVFYYDTFKNLISQFYKYEKLENIDYDFKTKLFEIFLKESAGKKKLGQFFTPMKVVQAINQMAMSELKEGMKICDPACGVGKFPLDYIKGHINKYFPIINNKISPKLEIFGFDKGFNSYERKTIVLAKANMLIYFSELLKKNKRITKELAELFNKSFLLETESPLGTLVNPLQNEFDLILANPPYSVAGTSTLKKEIAKSQTLTNYYSINAIGIENLFIQWIINALKPNGKAFIIIPDGIMTRKNDNNLRKLILKRCFIDAVISLPINIFHGTNKKTYILGITKKADELIQQKTPIFTYLVSEIGETRNFDRIKIEQNDLNDAVVLFNQFKQNKDEFSTTNQRCKIQSISKFEEEISWAVDKWWERDELVKLGLAEKETFINLKDFRKVVDDASEDLKALSLSLEKLDLDKKEEIKFKEIPISNLFSLKKSSVRYNKDYINKNHGEYPIYSAQSKGAIGKINAYNYDCQSLVITTAGRNAGTVFLVNDKFSLTSNCCALFPKDNGENVSLKYLYFYLSNEIKKLATGNLNNKIFSADILNFKVRIPVDINGEFDLLEQKKIVEKNNNLLALKEKSKASLNLINNKEFLINDELDNKKLLKIEEIFNLSISSSDIKDGQLFAEKNKGSIPIYSSSKFENSVDFGFIKDGIKGVKYFENCLTLNIDGSAGKIFFRKGKFSLSRKVIPLIISSKYQDCFDQSYLKIQLEKEFARHNFSYSNKPLKYVISKLTLEIPIRKDGSFNLEKQRLIVKKNSEFKNIGERARTELQNIQKLKVS